jgi:hypothetical protein
MYIRVPVSVTVRRSPPEPRCEHFPLFTTACGKLNNPIQIAGYPGRTATSS